METKLFREITFTASEIETPPEQTDTSRRLIVAISVGFDGTFLRNACRVSFDTEILKGRHL